MFQNYENNVPDNAWNEIKSYTSCLDDCSIVSFKKLKGKKKLKRKKKECVKISIRLAFPYHNKYTHTIFTHNHSKDTIQFIKLQNYMFRRIK